MTSKYTNFAITQEQSTILQICQIQIKKTRPYSRINIYLHLISTGGTDRQTDTQSDYRMLAARMRTEA